MDLVAGVKTIFVLTQHTTKHGDPKIVDVCTFPLTGQGVVDRVYTNLAVLEFADEGLRLLELAPGVDFDFVQQRTGVPLIRGPQLSEVSSS